MVGEVHVRRTMGARAVVEQELVAIGERIGHADVQGARVSLRAVGAEIREPDAPACGLRERRGLPHDPVEPAHTAVQMIRAVVPRQLVRSAVQEVPRTVGRAQRNQNPAVADDGATRVPYRERAHDTRSL
jgi:hypothetical protein